MTAMSRLSEAYLEYDPEGDVHYIGLGSGDVAGTQALGDYRNVDVSHDGTVLGIEFIDASQGSTSTESLSPMSPKS